MPTYDYLCDACGHKFELFQSINDPVQRKCPACKKLKLRRLFGTGAAVMFKGSGFYTTDYRSESYKKAASADASSGEGKSSKSSDSSGSSSKSESGSSGKSDSGSSSKSESSSSGKGSSSDKGGKIKSEK
jgi:putative FmdB family regulatory protein